MILRQRAPYEGLGPVKSEARRTCEACGAQVPVDLNICPVCALRGALDEGGDISEAEIDETRSSSAFRFDHYQILTLDDGTPFELGRGAMGVTYKAIDINLHCAVALKVINARFIGDEWARRRFVREARAAASVRHPNVASVFHLGKINDGYFYAMEFVAGESLDKVIRRSGALKPADALHLAAMAGAGLEAIAKQNLVHRDIKPSNLIVRWDGDEIVDTKIIDLGLAKRVAKDDSISPTSTQGAFVGTPAYASPEQFVGIATDIRSDLYSLGITLWEMLSGALPFHGTLSDLNFQHQHASLPLEKLTQIPPSVAALLKILLEKDPARRFQTPTAFLQAASKVSDALASARDLATNELRSGDDETTALPDVSRRRSHQLLRGKKPPLFTWGLTLVLLVTGLSFAWFFFSGHPGLLFNQPLGQAVPAGKSIAVLPFEDISANKDDAYFVDGVHDEILNNLAKVAQLKVISRTSVMQYRPDTVRDLRQIARALGVANVLEGTVRRDGDRIRVSTELIDASNDKTIWADSYDRDLTDIFAIQSEIAQTIAGKLTATLSPDEKKRIEAKPTENLEAYDLYLQAQELIVNSRLSTAIGAGLEGPMRDAVGLLEHAVQLDPNFTLAYCAAAHVHGLLYRFHDPTPERRALADAAIDHAMRLEPHLPEVHLAYAIHLYLSYRDYKRARVQLAIAERDLANNVEVFLLEGRIDRRQGMFEKALQEFNRAIERDPRNSVSIGDFATTLIITRQFAAAEKVYHRLIALAPEQPMLKVQEAFNIAFMKTANRSAFRSAVASLPSSVTEDRALLSLKLNFALYDRDWVQAKQVIQTMKDGEDNGYFAYAALPVPIGCYSILLARLRGEPPEVNPEFAKTREELNQKVLNSPESADLLSQLSVVDALLAKKETAITEAKHATEMLPLSEDAVDGPPLLINLAVVYAWTNEPDLAMETLEPLARIPSGVFYGSLRLDPLWDPLRKDPRFDKLLAELAPTD
jgi:serine/threonine protein kinase/Tfp pilus assembly protein PilF